jgi:nucleoside-diphosphate-sugar epimerase
MLVVRRASIRAQLRRAADRSVRSLFYWVSAEDCARAFRLALEVRGIRFGVYFVTAADTLIAEPTLDLLRRLWPAMPELRDPRRYADDAVASPFEGGAARRDFGFSPATRWSDLARGVA